nr:hypothetical protein [Pseudomonadota bacterium]
RFGVDPDSEAAEELAKEVVPCDWVVNRRRAGTSHFVTASHAARQTDKSGTFDAAGGQPRKIVWDESPEAHDMVSLTLESLAQWQTGAKRAESLPRPEGLSPEEWETWKTEAVAALGELAELMGRHCDAANHRIGPDDLDMARLLRVIEQAPRSVDGLLPEAVVYDARRHRVCTPFRALMDLGLAVERGTAWINEGLLWFSLPSQAVRDALAGKDVVIADATPSLLWQAMASGRVETVRAATPHQSIHFYTGRFHGKGRVDDPREAADLVERMSARAAAHGTGKVCVLTHKKFVTRYLRKLIGQGRVPGWRPEDAELVGWFGQHDRGQNRWMQCTCLIVWGCHFPEEAALERLYESDRVLVRQLGIEWRPWSGARQERWFDLPCRDTDGRGKRLAYQGYANPDQMAWLQDRVAAHMMQCVGRLRAVQRPLDALEVEIHSHFPVAGHGIWFDHVHTPAARTNGQQSRGDWARDLHEDALGRFEAARAAGCQSRRTMNRWLRENGYPTLGGDKYREILEQQQAAAQDDPVGDAELEVAFRRLAAFLSALPPPDSPAEASGLCREYAGSVEDPADRLAGLVLAQVLAGQEAAAKSGSPCSASGRAGLPERERRTELHCGGPG